MPRGLRSSMLNTKISELTCDELRKISGSQLHRKLGVELVVYKDLLYWPPRRGPDFSTIAHTY